MSNRRARNHGDLDEHPGSSLLPYRLDLVIRSNAGVRRIRNRETRDARLSNLAGRWRQGPLPDMTSPG